MNLSNYSNEVELVLTKKEVKKLKKGKTVTFYHEGLETTFILVAPAYEERREFAKNASSIMERRMSL